MRWARSSNTTARAAELVAGTIEAMQLAPVVLVATSNGANVALEYNRLHGQDVRAIALSILPLDRPSQTRKVDWRLRLAGSFHRALLPDYHFRWWYRLIIEDTSHPGYEPTDEIVDSVYDMANLPGAAEPVRCDVVCSSRPGGYPSPQCARRCPRAGCRPRWCRRVRRSP